MNATGTGDRLRRVGRRGVALWQRGGWLRLVVSGGLITFILLKTDAGELVRRWREIDPLHFGAATLLLAASNLLACLQWWVLLRAQGLHPPTRLILSSYHVALFFGNFLPGHYGGDAVRVYDIYRDSGEGYAALGATFVDRLLGLVSLCLLALAVAPAFIGPGDRGELLTLLAASVLVAGAVLLLFSRRMSPVFHFLIRPMDALGLADRVRAGYEAVHLYRHRLGAVVLALLVSIGVQTLRVFVHVETARAIGVETDARNFFLLVPLVAIFIALPVSVNGIGVRETSGIVLFRHVGVGEEDAVGLLFLAYLAGVLVSLSGGVIFALRGRSARFDPPPASC